MKNEWTDEYEAKRPLEREMVKIQADIEVGLAQANAIDNLGKDINNLGKDIGYLGDNMRYVGNAIHRNSCLIPILYF